MCSSVHTALSSHGFRSPSRGRPDWHVCLQPGHLDTGPVALPFFRLCPVALSPREPGTSQPCLQVTPRGGGAGGSPEQRRPLSKNLQVTDRYPGLLIDPQKEAPTAPLDVGQWRLRPQCGVSCSSRTQLGGQSPGPSVYSGGSVSGAGPARETNGVGGQASHRKVPPHPRPGLRARDTGVCDERPPSR